MAEGDGLENRCTERYRGFESLLLRLTYQQSALRVEGKDEGKNYYILICGFNSSDRAGNKWLQFHSLMLMHLNRYRKS